MRPLEIITPTLLAVYLLWLHPRPVYIRWIPAAGLVALLLHLATEGYRWQMIPVYAFTLMLIATSIMKIQSPTDWKPLASYLTFGLLALTTTIPALLPVPTIPPSSGPYVVGTRIYELIDESRREIYSGNNEARRFMIQIWYPSEANSSAERAPWMPDAKIYAPAISVNIKMPPFFLDHLALVKMTAYKESYVMKTENPIPIVLFSHGWKGFNAQNTGQALQLASNGYMVVAVQHTYDAIVTVFPDGTIARNNPNALPDGAPDDEFEIAARLLGNQRAGDLGFALDFLERHNNDSSSPLFERLDLNQVGVYGHSTGGGAGVQFCGIDSRCKSYLGQDPFMRPVSLEIIENGFSQPTFFMFSELGINTIGERSMQLFDQFYPRLADPIGTVLITGAAHYDFTDMPLLTPLAPQLGLKGPINGKLVTTIVNDYLLSFFDLTLKGKATDLFDKQTQKYAEVKILK